MEPMNEESKALAAFLNSPMGSNLLEPGTMGLANDKAAYLRNRLSEAFQAGLNSGKNIAVDRIAASMRKLAD